MFCHHRPQLVFVSVDMLTLKLEVILCSVSDLRRSPRIQKFARRHSNTFYSSSQPRSRNLDKALSASQLSVSDARLAAVDVKAVRSPLRLLFGAAGSPGRPCDAARATRSRLSTDSSVFEVTFLFQILKMLRVQLVGVGMLAAEEPTHSWNRTVMMCAGRVHSVCLLPPSGQRLKPSLFLFLESK